MAYRACAGLSRPFGARVKTSLALSASILAAMVIWRARRRCHVKVRTDHTATLSCEDGNGKTVFTKEIEFTDFPLDEITLYFTNNTILLPGEY
jgi:hypothetical protein